MREFPKGGQQCTLSFATTLVINKSKDLIIKSKFIILFFFTGTVIALISAAVVYRNGESLTSLLIDPILTLVSVAILAVTSYPFSQFLNKSGYHSSQINITVFYYYIVVQAGQILLQTTPAHIDVGELKTRLKDAFPSVVSIHDLHVWALTPERVISTAHLVFMNENVYLSVKDPINKFFLGQGITRVTLQPEFYKVSLITFS